MQVAQAVGTARPGGAGTDSRSLDGDYRKHIKRLACGGSLGHLPEHDPGCLPILVATDRKGRRKCHHDVQPTSFQCRPHGCDRTAHRIAPRTPIQMLDCDDKCQIFLNKPTEMLVGINSEIDMSRQRLKATTCACASSVHSSQGTGSFLR